MDGFVLYGDGRADHTLVSNLFLDEYMPAANGEYVKVYLYLLRCLESDRSKLSLSLIADKFDHTEGDIQRALKYWEKMNLLALEYDGAKTLTGIRLLDGNVRPSPQNAVSVENVSDSGKSTALEGSAQAFSDPAKAEGCLSQEDAKQLLFICEQYLGKTLSSTEVSRILYFHDSLGFDTSLIEYLIEYCVSHRHKSMRYIESVALAWHKEGYLTVAQAKEHTTTYSKSYFSILKAFGITNRNPVDVEISFMDKWMNDYGFSLDLITEACSRTMAAIHQPGFEYADKILSTWKAGGIASLADVKALDDKHASSKANTRAGAESTSPKKAAAPNRFHNFRERNYDYKELQKRLINN